MKTRIFIILVSFLCCFSLVNAQQRIVNGQAIDISQAPYQVAIFNNSEQTLLYLD